jgi:large subunit ribosomal protein L18
MRIDKKIHLERKRRRRIRKTLQGTKERPRMSVRFTQKNIHVQFIDDVAGATLAATGTLAKSMPGRETLVANAESAKKVGASAAETALKHGIKKVVFDRSGARFHGKVKALADAAREGGLEF